MSEQEIPDTPQEYPEPLPVESPPFEPSNPMLPDTPEPEPTDIPEPDLK